MEDFVVLFTSVGRRTALVRLFRQAIESLGLRPLLVTADLRPDASAAWAGDVHELVPRATESGYVTAVAELCRRRGVRLVVPLIDPELPILAEGREEIEAAGSAVLVSSPQCNAICFDKRRTERFFREAGFRAPRILDIEAVLADEGTTYPLFVKPARGSCSVGAAVVRNRKELEYLAWAVPDPVLQERVLGHEYTVDVLVDARGRARCAVPRLRVETRAGEVSKGLTVKRRDVMDAAARVAEALPGAYGCQTIQCFVTPEEEIVFIEVNPRFGGGFPLAAQAGADFPRWIVEWTLGRDPDIPFDAWSDELAMLRFDDAYFVPKAQAGW